MMKLYVIALLKIIPTGYITHQNLPSYLTAKPIFPEHLQGIFNVLSKCINLYKDFNGLYILFSHKVS
jgi:hypothetical protein